MSEWRQAVHYRNRATVLRSIAADTPRDDHKLALRQIADYYDQMATTLEDEANPAYRRGG